LKAQVVLDKTVPSGVVLVPRSMGLPVAVPGLAELKKASGTIRDAGTR
jgi:hypothetical protein